MKWWDQMPWYQSSECWALSQLFFLLLFFIYFNWGIFGLWYCVGFCHTSTWVTGMHIPPPSWTSLPPSTSFNFTFYFSLYWFCHISTFSLSSFTFIKRLFSSCSLSAIRVVSSAYLRLLIFLPTILIPACASSSPAFLMMYSACNLNKQGDNIQPSCNTFLIWNQSVIPCPVLTVASWPAYRFLKRQVRCPGIPISWRILHSLLWSTQSKALAWSIKQKQMFFWNSFAFSLGYILKWDCGVTWQLYI